MNQVTQEVTEDDEETIVLGLDFTKSMLLFIAFFILLLSVTILIYRSCRKHICPKNEVIEKKAVDKPAPADNEQPQPEPVAPVADPQEPAPQDPPAQVEEVAGAG